MCVFTLEHLSADSKCPFVKRCYLKKYPGLLSEFKCKGQTYKRVNYTSDNSAVEKFRIKGKNGNTCPLQKALTSGAFSVGCLSGLGCVLMYNLFSLFMAHGIKLMKH